MSLRGVGWATNPLARVTMTGNIPRGSWEARWGALGLTISYSPDREGRRGYSRSSGITLNSPVDLDP